MSATGTPTPNIGLRIPLGTDPASVDDINYNSNLIDTKLGAVGNDSVQDQIDTLSTNTTQTLGKVQDGLAIVANGNTHVAIPADYFVYVKGHNSLSEGLYKNTSGSTIAANATLSTSNLTADDDGGLNSVYSTLNSKIRPSDNAISYTLKSGFSLESWGQINARVVGGILLLSIGGLATNHAIDADEEFLTFTNFTFSNMGSSYGVVWVSNRDKPGNISAFSGKIYLNRIPANAIIIGQLAIPIYV